MSINKCTYQCKSCGETCTCDESHTHINITDFNCDICGGSLLSVQNPISKWIKYTDQEPADGQWIMQCYTDGLMGVRRYQGFGPEVYKIVLADPLACNDWYWMPRIELPPSVPQNYPYGDKDVDTKT